MAEQEETPQTPPPPLAVDAHARYLASFARVWEEDADDGGGPKQQQGATTTTARAADADAGDADAPSTTPTPRPLPLLEHVASEHFWLSGLYWGLTALHLLGRLDDLDTSKAWRWVQRCFKRVDGAEGGGGGASSSSSPSPPSPLGRLGGGYGGSPRHDAHLLSTTSAVQVAALLGKLDEVDASAVEECEFFLLLFWFWGGARRAAAPALTAPRPRSTPPKNDPKKP
jgi:hypothetical protein